MPDPLDNPVRAALLGAHHRYAVRDGRALAYRPGYSPFAALPDEPAEEDWAALARLVGAHGVAVLFGGTTPVGWTEQRRFDALQMVTRGPRVPVDPTPIDPSPIDPTPVDPTPVDLGPDDLNAVLGLVARTEPGPFLGRTLELGHYLGLRCDGRLVAMAGERMRFAGWTEVSAVCTDPAVRGRGFAGRLVRAVVAGAATRGDAVFLHVLASNVGAVRLYESLGFVVRKQLVIVATSPPRPGLLVAGLHPEADPAHGVDGQGDPGLPDLAPDPFERRVDQGGVAEIAAAPGVLEQFTVGPDPTGVRHETAEDRALPVGER